MAALEKQLEDRGLSEASDGAIVIDFTKHLPGRAGKTLAKALLRNKDSSSLYLTRDLEEVFKRSITILTT